MWQPSRALLESLARLVEFFEFFSSYFFLSLDWALWLVTDPRGDDLGVGTVGVKGKSMDGSTTTYCRRSLCKSRNPKDKIPEISRR
jgi:hypothetical protein